MKQEDKDLLLKDLCARLLYGVICTDNRHGESRVTEIDIESGVIYLFDVDEYVSVEKCRPYLRPMSSMTEEEKEELSHLLPKDWSVEIDKLNNFYFDMSPSIFMEIDIFLNIIDWLNAHHFDFHNLIERGLAIDCTGLNVY